MTRGNRHLKERRNLCIAAVTLRPIGQHVGGGTFEPSVLSVDIAKNRSCVHLSGRCIQIEAFLNVLKAAV